MTKTLRSRIWMPVLLAGAALLAACAPGNPGTRGGSQSHTPPVAAITPIGYAPAPDGSITVRSGALVVLSGKDSVSSDDPILRYQWTGPVDPTTQQALPYLTNTTNSLTFFAPPVPAGTTGTGASTVTMQVSLTVETASGLSNTTSYTVHVVRALDEDDFLVSQVLARRANVQLKIVAAAATGQALATDAPFTLTVKRHVLYRLRTDTPGSPTGDQVVETRTLSGAWLADYGIAGGVDPNDPAATLVAAQAAASPRFVLRPPVLSDLDVNLAVASAGAVPPSKAFDISSVNDAEAEYEVTLTPTSSAASVPLALVALARNGNGEQVIGTQVAASAGAPVTLVVKLNDVLGHTTLAGPNDRVNAVEDAASAIAYYAALDPNGAKTTLDAWLRDNCFDPSAATFGGDANAVYTNNFDLGFGRDMHFRTNCTAAQQSALGATINTAAGERAAIVINYPSLESAARHVGGFLAVGMEYRVPPCLAGQGACPTTPIVSFWTFAQDPVTGVWQRVISANFDGRGQHYTPGNCTVCHGGRPKAATDYQTTNADLGAVFLPWDTKALLFGDTDPAFRDDTLRPAYTKAAQLPNIRALNRAMVDTLTTDVTNCNSSNTPADDCSTINAGRKVLRDLASGWADGSIGESYVPPGWAGATSIQGACGASGQPACVSPSQLYTDVIAQHCRSCHLQRIAEPATNGTLIPADAPSFADYASYFGNANLVPTLVDRVFTHGLMPGSRLTTDRFWLGGAAAPAAELANHLGLASTAGLLGPVAVPQALQANGDALTTVSGTSVQVAAPGETVRLTGRGSALAASYSWTLTGPADPATGAAPQLVGASDMEPAFVPAVAGTYVATLTVTDVTGQVSSPASVTIAANSKPTAPASISATLALVNGTYQVTVDLLHPPSGNPTAVQLGDGVNVIALTSLTPSYASVAGAPGQSRACPAGSGASCIASCLATDTSCAIVITSPVSATVGYSITDQSPPPLAPDVATGSITAVNPVTFQAGSGSVAVAAWRPGTAGTALNLDSVAGLTGPSQVVQSAFGTLPAGWYYALTISTPPAARGRSGAFDSSALLCGGGATGSASAASSGATVTYVPPPYFVSSQGGASAAGACNGGAAATDAFGYTIGVYDGANNLVATSSEGTVKVSVNSTTSGSTAATFASVYSQVLSAKCATCHGNTPPTGANWATASRQRAFLDLPGSPPLGLASAGCPVTAASAGGITDAAPPPYCLQLGPASGATPVDTSLLYTKPQGTNHGGGKVLDPAVPADAALLQLIRDWLLDGAYNN
ncbi:MAG: hypothetical protein JSR54_02460 [Proteobacteria bacterium]|nr:hypothetical protein [Pseudomonadota bacterium]